MISKYHYYYFYYSFIIITFILVINIIIIIIIMNIWLCFVLEINELISRQIFFAHLSSCHLKASKRSRKITSHRANVRLFFAILFTSFLFDSHFFFFFEIETLRGVADDVSVAFLSCRSLFLCSQRQAMATDDVFFVLPPLFIFFLDCFSMDKFSCTINTNAGNEPEETTWWRFVATLNIQVLEKEKKSHTKSASHRLESDLNSNDGNARISVGNNVIYDSKS